MNRLEFSSNHGIFWSGCEAFNDIFPFRYEGDKDNSARAVAGGVVAALTLAYQEAKQGPWMARGFVQRFLECGGAKEVTPHLR